MIVKSYNLGNTRINIADDFQLHDEKQKQMQIDNFNRIGCMIMQNLLIKEGVINK